MKPGEEECPVCRDSLQIACKEFGEKQPQFCDINERYLIDPNYGTEEAITELTLFITTEQKKIIADRLMEYGKATR